MYTILHLETSMLYKTLIREISVELSARYINAASASEAVDILKRENISLILTVMELEEGSSVDFIKALNESEFKNIPVVVITGNDSLEDRKRMYDLGIVDYILKKSEREQIKNNLAVFRRDDPVAEKMNKLRYAVLDDNKMDRKIIERIFAVNDITNVAFYDSEKSLVESGENYDVYIIDLVLENTSGDKVIMKLREKDPGSVVIAVSGIDNVKTVSRVLSIGADDYLTKPFNYELFIARLKTNIRAFMLMQELRKKKEELEKMAVTDSLTALFNRRHIYDRLRQEAEKVERYSSKFSILMFDIDFFKRINDLHGHQFGDIVLRKVADAIKQSIRNVDIAGRYGGEEFLIILPEIQIKGAVTVAERIRSTVEKTDTGVPDLKVTVSGGAAEYLNGDVEELVKKADKLMYEAKESGRNCIRF
ncbi:MAG TPA: diguanylate cyclase [Spirochaetota bacterium]|nr:diguanylate cyclase [Spirochaetota bacterium]